jgi:hypothetical protein
MVKSFENGDVIYVIRAPFTDNDKKVLKYSGLASLTFRHYGIFVGNDSVVHFVGDSGYFSGDLRIKQTSINEFAKGTFVDVDVYAMNQRVFPREEVVNRALNNVGSAWGGYNVLTNNCEHFTQWAITGNKVSRQALLLITGYTNDQDFVTNTIDRAVARVDKAFDPLIMAWDRIDRVMGWVDHKYKSGTVSDIFCGNFKKH